MNSSTPTLLSVLQFLSRPIILLLYKFYFTELIHNNQKKKTSTSLIYHIILSIYCLWSTFFLFAHQKEHWMYLFNVQTQHVSAMPNLLQISLRMSLQKAPIPITNYFHQLFHYHQHTNTFGVFLLNPISSLQLQLRSLVWQ